MLTLVNKLGDLLWIRSLPYPAVDIFDVYSRPDDTLAIVKQLVPELPSTGEIGKMLSNRAPATTAYVGNYNGHMFAMSTENFPLIQLAEAYGRHVNTLLLDGGPRTDDDEEEEEDDDYNDSYSHTRKKTYKRPAADDHLYDPLPNAVCRIESPEFLTCMKGLHGVVSLYTDQPRSGQIDASDGSLENQSGNYRPSQVPEHDGKYALGPEDIKESGMWHDGIGKFWKTYILLIFTFCYWKRKHIHDSFVLYGVPLINQYVEPLIKQYVLPHVDRYVDSYRQRRGEDVDSDSNKSDKKAKKKLSRNRKKSKDIALLGVDSQASSTAIDIHTMRAEGSERTVTFAEDTELGEGSDHTTVNFSNTTTPSPMPGRTGDLQFPLAPTVSSALTVTDTILGKCQFSLR